MITWHLVTDDYGNKVSVTEVNYPVKTYFTRVLQHYFK